MDNHIPNTKPEFIEDDISFIDVFIFIGQVKWSLIFFSFSFSFIAALISLLITPIFTAKTLVLPPQLQQSSSTSNLANINSLTSVASGVIGIRSPDDMYVSLMNSEVFQKKIIERLKLNDRYKCPFIVDCRVSLNSHIRIISDKKSSLMSIEADDIDPIFAANLANAYINELSNLMGKLALTEAQQKRSYFENQIKKTSNDLILAEQRFRSAQQKSGLRISSIEADIGLREISDLRTQIASREIQLQALSIYSTPQNSDVKRLLTELTAMKMQLLKIERGGSESNQSVTSEQEAIQAYRNMKVQESLLEAFAKQYEIAKVDESKESPLIQVIDPATPPERRSSPKRTQIVLFSSFGGFLFSLIFEFFKRLFTHSSNNSQSQIKLNQLKRSWKL